MKKRKNNKSNFISIIVVTMSFIIMLITFYQNITLKQKRDELNNYLNDYQKLKDQIKTFGVKKLEKWLHME